MDQRLRYCCYSTACTPLEHDQVDARARVKCIVDTRGYAMYFSRSPLPGNKDGKVRTFPPACMQSQCHAMRHVPAGAALASLLPRGSRPCRVGARPTC